MNVSPNFSPPIQLMKPYFLLSGFFYFASFVTLFFLDPSTSFNDFSLIGWVHLYMLGFVMMSIFAAMAQLGPIVVETKHSYVHIFKFLWMFLLSGLLILLYGFLKDVSFLLYGGLLILIAMLIYAIEFLFTISNSKRKTSITKAMKMSNFFLIIGITTGLIMAASFNGLLNINPQSILQIHTFGLVVGFVILLIMGISIILIPMFGSSARISDNEFSKSFYTIAFGVLTMMFSAFLSSELLKNIAYIIVIVAILLYFYQLYTMTRSRKRIKHDVWAKSMYVAFFSFILAFILLVSFLFTHNPITLKVGMWLLFIGFFGNVIVGNFYKIIPFLIWFHIYSPLIEERAVPMLHELLPNRQAQLQWFFSSLGLILTTLALFIESSELFKGGIILFCASSLTFFIIIINLLKVKI